MNIRHCITLFLFFLVAAKSSDQHPKDYFRSPMDIGISLSGNFGDFRTNHFHSGIDIRTQGVIGKKIYASAEGFISRIRISPYGYGNAIYIKHPNGYTSLYGHLNRFNEKLQGYIHAKQYELELNTIDYYPEENEIKIEKGEVLGYGGNSGSSSGPHLHFEIRDSQTEQALNPMLFGFDIKDNVKPEIYELYIYPKNEWSTINGKNEKQSFTAKLKNGVYQSERSIRCNGKFGIGIYALDRFTNGKYKHTFYELTMIQDNKETYHFKYDALDFETLRDVNCHMDYEEKRTFRKKITKCFRAPESRLDFYTTNINDGIVEISEGQQSSFEIRVNDIRGNTARVQFDLLGESSSVREQKKEEFDKILKAQSENALFKEDISLYFPDKRLYEDQKIVVYQSEETSVHISPNNIPLKDWYRLKWKLPVQYEKLSDKIIICKKRKSGSLKALMTNYEKGELSCKPKEFGQFVLRVDTLAPEIKLKNEFNLNKLVFKVHDNFDQITGYKASIDGKWLRIFYDAKKDEFVCRPQEIELEKGLHNFYIECADLQGNLEVFQTQFQN
ncbi:MAG: M23 family metallopeptidase [Bacteroidota bacterium]